ncbi:MAG: 23S rRNA pseudouridine(1911/1915/1917) synthase RluD [Pseudomonadota bacterium]
MKTPQNIIELQGEIPHHSFNKRLDQSLAEMFPDFSRTKIKQWIEQGDVLLNGQKNILPKSKVQGGETVVVATHQVIEVTDQAQSMPLDITFEDEHIIVVNKPAGLVVHPGAGNKDNTLLNALLSHYPEIEKVPRAGIVHRLDKETTGLMVVAKTIQAQASLVDQLQQRNMGREYEAIVCGQLIAGGSIDQPIGRHPSKRTLMAVRYNGKAAVTHYRIIEKFRAHTHLRVKLESGRTHQIRVHMSHIKHPLVGDSQYGGRPQFPKKASQPFLDTLRMFKRQALHAAELTLSHPSTKTRMSWQSELPHDFTELVAMLRQDTLENQDDVY